MTLRRDTEAAVLDRHTERRLSTSIMQAVRIRRSGLGLADDRERRGTNLKEEFFMGCSVVLSRKEETGLVDPTLHERRHYLELKDNYCLSS